MLPDATNDNIIILEKNTLKNICMLENSLILFSLSITFLKVKYL